MSTIRNHRSSYPTMTATSRVRALALPFAFAMGVALPIVDVTVAFAQGTPNTGGGGGGGGGAAPAGGGGGGTSGGAPGGGTTTTTTVQGPTQYQFYPGGVAPTGPGQTLGGGNAQYSSSKPITGNERDGFDFRANGPGGGSVHGSENGSFVLGEKNTGSYTGVVPNVHNVRRGDTLWGICGFYFHNPYQWPRIWSYNAQIQNPHWIYPGDQVKLKGGAGDLAPVPSKGTSVTDRRRQVPPETVFLRNVGFIEDDQQNWGELNGAREDKIFLADFDEVYLRIASGHDVKMGQELTVYRPIKNVGGGKLIQIQGTVKVDQWNEKDRVARARITETLDTIERGARIGPIVRRFEVVPPLRNEQDVEATILTSVTPHEIYGQSQVVFIDKGEEDGLKPGNRLFVIRKGDGFHKTKPSDAAATRIALESESPAATEQIPGPRNDNALPEEVLAELRVVNVKKHTAMALVTTSRREIEIGDKGYGRKGY